MISDLKNKLHILLMDLRSNRIININRKYWRYHQKGISQAKKREHALYLKHFTFDRNYRLIKLLSSTIHIENKKGS
jgi:hypothetical protein